jgi:hypothetical protein
MIPSRNLNRAVLVNAMQQMSAGPKLPHQQAVSGNYCKRPVVNWPERRGSGHLRRYPLLMITSIVVVR